MSGSRFVKQRIDAPSGFYAAEAAGLNWLAEPMARGGARVVLPLEPVARDGTRIALARIRARTPDAASAEDLGRRLAVTHTAGADWFGCPPKGWHGAGFIGPIAMPYNTEDRLMRWGRFFADHRLAPFVRQAEAAGSLSPRNGVALERVCERLRTEDEELCGPPEPVCRLHGDLWSGNIMWDDAGAVLIDPSAHGGHRESDLAMLALFGGPHVSRIVAAYHEASPLADARTERIGLHQLYPLLVHAVLFGADYGRQAGDVARRYL